MGRTGKDFGEGVYAMKAMHPCGMFQKRADAAQGWATNLTVGGLSLSQLPTRMTLAASGAGRRMSCPQTIAFRTIDQDGGGGIYFTARVAYIDAFGKRKVREVSFGPSDAGGASQATIFQTPFCVAELEYVEIIDLRGHAGADVIGGSIYADTLLSNSGWGFQLPRHLKSTADFRVYQGWTSQAADTQLKAPDFAEGIYYPAASNTEKAFFLVCVPEQPTR